MGAEDSARDHMRALDVEGAMDTQSIKDKADLDEEVVHRTGTIFSAFMLVITAVIGAGVLSLPYSVAVLGWVAGIISLIVFSWVTLYTSWLLADVNIVKGQRMRDYMQNVEMILGTKAKIVLGWNQQVNLVLTALAYSITSTLSLQAVASSLCSDESLANGDCFNSYWRWAVIFGSIQIVSCFMPNLHSATWPAIVGATMSFGYSSIAIGKSISEGNTHGTVGGISDMTTSEKTFGVFNSLGAILFAYSFSIMLPEIQDTLSDTVKGGPVKAMKRTVSYSMAIMTVFYMVVAITGYMAYGNAVSGMILDSFENPTWLVIMGHLMIVIHMVPAYQVWSNPFFIYVEQSVRRTWPNRHWLFRGWAFRLWYRPAYVVILTFITICMPFFSYIVGFIGAIGFWPVTVYFPVEMWIKLFNPSPRKKFWLEVLNWSCFVVTMIALIGSVQSIVDAWTTFCFFCD